MATNNVEHEPKLENLRVSGDGAPAEDEDDLVNPWDIQAKANTGVDYDKLISKLLHGALTIKSRLKAMNTVWANNYYKIGILLSISGIGTFDFDFENSLEINSISFPL